MIPRMAFWTSVCGCTASGKNNNRDRNQDMTDKRERGTY